VVLTVPRHSTDFFSELDNAQPKFPRYLW